MSAATRNFDGISLRTAAIVAGLAYVVLLNPVIYAEFNLYRRSSSRATSRKPLRTSTFTASQLQAQVQLLLSSFRSGWNISLILFAIHLVLIGYLIYRSSYLLKLLGVVIAVVGLGWIVNVLQPFFYPAVNFDWFFFVSFAELLLPLWLLTMGWRIKQPDPV